MDARFAATMRVAERVRELLDRNEPVDLASLRGKCQALGLGTELERVLRQRH